MTDAQKIAAHEALVDALRLAERVIQAADEEEEHPITVEALKRIRAALSLATEGK